MSPPCASIRAKRHAEPVVATGQADADVMARELPRDPDWPLHAARSLDTDLPWPLPYERSENAPDSGGSRNRLGVRPDAGGGDDF
ncbi:MAG: hypothetical protein WBV95_00260 [Desulfobacterales bacterium]